MRMTTEEAFVKTFKCTTRDAMKKPAVVARINPKTMTGQRID